MSRFDCPIEWCTGGVLEHGGDGSAPDSWYHHGESVELGATLWAERFQAGGDTPAWAIFAKAGGELLSGTSEELADALELAARAVRAAGRVLEADI